MQRTKPNRYPSIAFPRSYRLRNRRAAIRTPVETAMEQYLIEQYLARIGYASYPEPDSRPDMSLATEEEDQAGTLNQCKQGFTYQQRGPAAISSRSRTQTRGPELREETTSPSILYDTSSTNPWSEREASYQVFEPMRGYKSPSPPPPSPPARPTETERQAGHHSALGNLQNNYLEIERQINACQKQIRSHPSKQKKINKEHDKRIAKFMKPAHDEKQNPFEATRRTGPETAQEAEIEEMRNIYLQYDRGSSIGVPNANVVDGLFAIVANTELHLKKAEEANMAAKERVAKLEDQFDEVRCVIRFEKDDGIGSVGDGVVVEEATRPEVQMSKIGSPKQGRKRKSRRRREGAKDRRQGKGGGRGEG